MRFLLLFPRGFVLFAFMAIATMTFAGTPSSSPLLDIPVKDIDGKETSLKAYAGKVLLVVNVASQCGSTPQYEGLQGLYEEHRDKGLVVLGFPSNDFGGQEPGSNAEIKEFCTTNYKVTFPMFDKVGVKGTGQHPLYAALTGPSSPLPGEVSWNFSKFLIGRDGKVVKRFDPSTEPTDPEVVKAIEDELAKK